MGSARTSRIYDSRLVVAKSPSHHETPRESDLGLGGRCSPAFGTGEPPIRNFVGNAVLRLVGKRLPKSFRRAAPSRHGSTVFGQRFSVFQNDQVLEGNRPERIYGR
jgi:hypothetical protein